MVLSSIDLFSGVGGITHALRGLAHPLVYCEIDPHCQMVIKKHMASGTLPKATIHSDISSLDGRPYRGKVDLVCGGSPCFPAGALVTTERGYVPIEDLQPGDLVWTHEGHMQEVRNTQRKLHTEHTVKLAISHHPHIIETTDEHPFFVRDRISSGGLVKYSEPHWVKAKDLSPGFHMVGTAINTASTIPEFETEIFANKTTSRVEVIRLDKPEDWFLMGYFLGDGWLQNDGTKKRKYNIYFVIADNEKQEAILNTLNKVMTINYREAGRGCTKYRAGNKAWWNILNEFGRYAHGKRVPQWVHDAPTSLLREFLNGYMAADGSVRPEGHEWRTASVSPAVSLAIQTICAKLGFVASVRKDKKAKTCVIEGRTVNQRCAYHVSFRPERLRAGCAFLEGNYTWYKLRSAETIDSPPQYVYNCEVAVDNSYHVDNIAVHNCIGFSKAGKGEGFGHAQSGLFAHMARIVKEVQPRFVFMENVQNIINSDGFDDLLKTMTSLGYDTRWLLLGASDVGAPHRRKRWFALAVLRGAKAQTLTSPKTPRFNWSREPSPRWLQKPGAFKKERMHEMANGVVPDCVRAAFLILWTGGGIGVPEAFSKTSFTLALPTLLKPMAVTDPHRSSGICIKGKLYWTPEPTGLTPFKNMNLVLLGNAVPRPAKMNPGISTGLVKRRNLPMWATPRGQLTSACVLTGRCTHDLSTQVRFEKSTTNREGIHGLNPVWVEWLMGYHHNWTAVPTKIPFKVAEGARPAAEAAAERPPSNARTLPSTIRRTILSSSAKSKTPTV